MARSRAWRLVGLLAAVAIGGPGVASGSGTEQPAGEARFTVDRTVAEVGRTRIIPVQLGAIAQSDTVWAASVEPADHLEVLNAPRILSGQVVGYVRVLGLSAGVATLRVGEASIEVEVVEPRAPGTSRGAPRLIAPSDGAVVWGTFSVGVERAVEPRKDEGRLWLRVGADGRLDPARVSDAAMGPDRRAVFDVDAAGLPTGVCELTPMVTLADGSTIEGEPVRVRVETPERLAIHAGEAEARYDVERPRRFQDSRTNTGRNEEASGGAYFNNFGSYPALCFPVAVERAGWYQVTLRAMGTLAGGELPWVDIVVDGAEAPATGGPLVSMRWHRLPIGTPIWLEPGTRVITPFFANDFYVPNAADRNLLIDTIEVARLSPPESPAESAVPSLESVVEADAGSVAEPGSAMIGMAAMGAGWNSGGDLADPMGERAVPLRIALDRILHGATLTGDLLVEGQAWTRAERGGASRVPEVALLINDREVARQRTFAPRFLIDADEFEEGENTVQMVATVRPPAGGTGAGGVMPGAMPGAMSGSMMSGMTTGQNGDSVELRAATPHQSVVLARPPGAIRGAVLRTLRFGIHDRGWDDHTRELFRNEHYPRERVAVAMYSKETIRLSLPESLAGRFRVGVEALGTDFEGPPVLSIELESAREGPSPVGRVSVATWWDTRFAESPIDLPPGPKSLVATFANDHYGPGRGDRNVWIQSLVLAEMPAASEESNAAQRGATPVVRLLYPREGSEFFMHGVVAVEACDDDGVERLELVVDGVETGVRRWVRRQAGPFTMPLLCRTLEAGEHTVSVRAYDGAGNVSESAPATIRVLAQEPETPTEYDRAVTLVDRLAFGPDDRELAAVLTMGSRAWLADRLGRSLDDPGDQAAMAPGLVRFDDGRYEYGPPRRAMEHAFFTPNPVRTRFVLWAQNHFSTWLRKAEGDRKWREHVEFARLGVAPFQDLLLASARSPAMLRYLDQDQSFAGRLNENYAREIMELHTLGVDGGYTQADVTSLAGVLTGWTASTLGGGGGGGPRGFQFRFDPSVSSGDPARVVGLEFGQTLRADRYDRALMAIEALASHPSTARHVATRLCEAYATVPAPPGLVQDLSIVFDRTGGDMGAMLIAMIEHPEFWAACRERRVCTPFDYALRLARSAGYHHPWRIGEFLQLSGFQVFDRSTPDGYPTEDAAYSDSNAMIQRWSLAQDASWAILNHIPDPWRWAGVQPDRAWAVRVVDAAAIRLTGRVLGERSTEAAVALLLESSAPVPERVRMIAPLIAQMPEANLR